MEAAQELHDAFKHNFYLFRRKVFKLFGGAFHAYDENGIVLLYSEQKAFKLKEDFRIYSDERMIGEILTIKTPQILDIGATYNVQDPATGQMIGSLRRKAIKSIFKDEWVILSSQEQEIGRLTEESMLAALISRVVNLVPQKYVIIASDGTKVADIKQHFNPFILKYSMSILQPNGLIDRRLIISAGILLAAIERRQQ